MSNDQHPVSMLQEVMAKRRKPIPVYNIEYIINSGFHCIVNVDGIKVRGIGASKQTAKYTAARLALIRLGFIKDTVLSRPEVKSTLFSTNEVTVVGGNFIGALHKLVAKKGLTNPNFYDRGQEGSEWVIECTLTGYATKGCAQQKKEAKQLAAKKMLEKMAEESIKMSKFHMKDKSFPPGNQSTDIGREYRSSTCTAPNHFQTSFLDELEESEGEEEEEPEYEEPKKQIETERKRMIPKIPLPIDEYVKSWTEKLLNMDFSQRIQAQKLINEVLKYGQENKLNASSTVLYSTQANNLEIYEKGQCLNHHPKPEYVIFKCK